MVEIRKLQPTVQMRKLIPVEMRETQQRQRQVIVVERRLRDFPPPTPQPTPCRLWQGMDDPNGYGRRKIKVAPGTGPNLGWRTVSMHRWVIETVYGIKLNREQVVMHRCDNRLCYRFDHLLIGTTQLNTADMMAKGRGRKPPVHHFYGAKNPNVRFTEAHVAWVKDLSAQGYYQKTIAEMTGISKSHVQRILAGKTWWHQHQPNAKGPPDEYRFRPGHRRATVTRREPGSEPPGVDPEGGRPVVEGDPHPG